MIPSLIALCQGCNANSMSNQRKDQVLAYCRSLAELGAWPSEEVLNPQRWLSNFLPEELPFALDMLESLIVVTSKQTDSMIRQLTNSFESQLTPKPTTRKQEAQLSKTFRSKWLVAGITKETPNPSESGPTYLRKFRQKLSVDKNQIFEQQELIDTIITKKRYDAVVVLVDD